MDKRNSGRGWPLSIIGIFIFLAFMLFGILYISLVYVPVNKENLYLMDYQDVDKNYNDIQESSEAFDAAYDAELETPMLSEEPVKVIHANGREVFFDHSFSLEGANRLTVTVHDAAGKPVSEADVTLLLTRYETTLYDSKPTMTMVAPGRYETDAFTIDQPGRWKIQVRITVDDVTGYIEQGVFAK